MCHIRCTCVERHRFDRVRSLPTTAAAEPILDPQIVHAEESTCVVVVVVVVVVVCVRGGGGKGS